MDKSNTICDNPKYRDHIARLALEVFRVHQNEPDAASTKQEAAEFMKLVKTLEDFVTERAMMLSEKFDVPIEIVHADIRECEYHLPKEDLLEAQELREQNRLN